MPRVAARLHSSTALALGAFLFAHLVAVWPATSGREAWIAAVAARGRGDTFAILIVAVLVLHAGLGAVRLAGPRPPGAELGGRAMAWLQAGTGAVVAGFVARHLLDVDWLVDGPHRGAAHAYLRLRAELDASGLLVAYVAGITAAVFHFGHGASRLPFAWGLDATPKSVRVARYAAGFVCAVLWLGYLQVLSHLAVGTGLLGSPAVLAR